MKSKPIHHGWITQIPDDDPDYWKSDEADNNIIQLKEFYIWEHLGIEEKIEVLREVVLKLLDKEGR